MLYIVAFIILPTAVLVSCIWALILLRKGALLPARRADAHDISQKITQDGDAATNTLGRVEETGEHMLVDPVPTESIADSAEPVVTAPVAQAPVDGDQAAPPAVASLTPAPADDGPPPTERTQELDVLPPDAADAPDESVDRPAIDTKVVSNAAVARPEIAGMTADAPATATPSADASGVLIVPLDEPAATRTAASDAMGGAPFAVPVGAEAGADDAAVASPVSPAPSPRRPPRRIVQLRPADEAASGPRPRAGQRRGGRRPGG